MASVRLETAPVLSTPDTHIFEDPTPTIDASSNPRLPDEQIALTYEIERTVKEIREGRWKRIALQFPDHMLADAPRVYEHLVRGLRNAHNIRQEGGETKGIDGTVEEDNLASRLGRASIDKEERYDEERIFILADTSYGACCVDEVAAEHVDADVVVHYGRSCLSPPSRLPVIYVFTERELELEPLISAFENTFPDKAQRIILMADIPYCHHIPILHARLLSRGYTSLYATEVVHNPSSLLPNRTIPPEASHSADALHNHHLFHISEPPPSLLLTISSRVSSIHIYPTDTVSPTANTATTTLALRRRYALLTSLTSASVFGILINTLSVKNYMHILSHVQQQITCAGKKYYTFVVGKVNAAKVANFSEVGGWVVIGCWESSLIESKDFWKPIITPFELEIALLGDEERVWTGEWTGDFQTLLEGKSKPNANGGNTKIEEEEEGAAEDDAEEYDSEEESAPPEFDLRTGRYVSHTRPMRASGSSRGPSKIEGGKIGTSSTALTKRANGDLAQVGGVVSPGAEFLREKRTWQGLGSDFRSEDEANAKVNGNAAKMEEGRSGIASGYVVGDDERMH